MGRSPKISIGIPVRNGQAFLSQAIDSLLSQTFGDFELIICDNASTDQTESICRSYVASDPRVRYFRNATNLGPAQNHNKCFNLSRGEYFRWHAHDDLCEPTHLAQCVAALDADPSIVIAYPKTLIIDEHNKPIENYDFTIRTDSPSVVTRFGDLVLVNHRMHRAVEIFGLMRTSALLKTPLQGAYARGDSVLLVRMALLGRFVELPQRLFLSRMHGTQSMQTMPAHKRRSRMARLLGCGPLPPPEWWDASRKGKVNFPEWNLMKEYWRSIGKAKLSWREQIGCHGVMLAWTIRNLHKLLRDVLFAIEIVLMHVLDALFHTKPRTTETTIVSPRRTVAAESLEPVAATAGAGAE